MGEAGHNESAKEHFDVVSEGPRETILIVANLDAILEVKAFFEDFIVPILLWGLWLDPS